MCLNMFLYVTLSSEFFPAATVDALKLIVDGIWTSDITCHFIKTIIGRATIELWVRGMNGSQRGEIMSSLLLKVGIVFAMNNFMGAFWILRNESCAFEVMVELFMT